MSIFLISCLCLYFVSFPSVESFPLFSLQWQLYSIFIVYYCMNIKSFKTEEYISIYSQLATVSTCCIVLVVVDELWDGAEIMLLCQVNLALWGGADVIMSAVPTSVPVERRVTLVAGFHRHRNLLSFITYAWAVNIFSALSTTVLLSPAMKKFCRQISPCFAWIIYISPCAAHCFRFHYKQFFFWYVHTWLEPVDRVLQQCLTWLTHPPVLLNKDTVYFPALLESRTRKPPSLFWEATHKRIYKFKLQI